MIKTNCGVCGAQISSTDKMCCTNCKTRNRINYEIGFALFLFFSMPSFFIAKGTGQYWYLLSGFIGLMIYMFCAKYVRDKDKTFKELAGLLQFAEDYQRFTRRELGIFDFLGKHIDEVELPGELAKSEQINKFVYQNQIRVNNLGPDDQLKELARTIDVDTILSSLECTYKTFKLNAKTIEKYNSDLKGEINKKGIYLSSPFD